MVMQIGGLLLGLLGDKIGRKRATLYAVCGMTVATIGTGCLPSRLTGGPLSEMTGVTIIFIFRCIQVSRPRPPLHQTQCRRRRCRLAEQVAFPHGSWWHPTGGVLGWACGHARQPRHFPSRGGRYH